MPCRWCSCSYLLLLILCNAQFLCDASKIVSINLHFLINFLGGLLAASANTYTGSSIFQLFCYVSFIRRSFYNIFFTSLVPNFSFSMEAEYQG